MRFKSELWNIDFSFEVDSNLTLMEITSALLEHFEFEKHIQFNTGFDIVGETLFDAHFVLALNGETVPTSLAQTKIKSIPLKDGNVISFKVITTTKNYYNASIRGESSLTIDP